jgi:hypothetical protein
VPITHVWIAAPAHVVSVGAQPPTHIPPMHVWCTQGEVPVQLPVMSQVCGVFPLHCVCPGAHTPMQAPMEHVWFVHGVGVPHIPIELHCTTPLPEHFKSPTAHTPAHMPGITQVEFEQGISFVLHMPVVESHG